MQKFRDALFWLWQDVSWCVSGECRSSQDGTALVCQFLRDDALRALVRLSEAKRIEPYCTQRLTRQGAVVDVSIVSSALIDETGKIYAIATTERLINGDVHG